MNDTVRLDVRPEVDRFVTAVRARFADLSAEEREELLGGLEADIADLVAEQGPAALGDPTSYADELRTAAGLPPAGRTRMQRPVGDAVAHLLDASRARWEGLVTGLPGDPWGFLVTLSPAWWVARAWLACQLVDLVLGDGRYNLGLSPVPTLGPFGLPLLLVAIVLSVQIGRGRLWPGRPQGGVAGRVLLAGLNALAVVVTPLVLTSLFTPEKAVQWGMEPIGYIEGEAVAPRGLSFDGQPVVNIYPYDAAGNPLVGVQLVDDRGRRLEITDDPYGEGSGWGDRALAPWVNGRRQHFNVFPLPEQPIDADDLTPVGTPALQPPPYDALPPVRFAGVEPTETVLEKAEPEKKTSRKKGERRR